jgi:alkylation response protein AidB-like acyl-CoA dehydrogenase
MELDELQTAIQESLKVLLDRRAGPQRVRALTPQGVVDRELLTDLYDVGFLDLFRDPDAGPLCAALVTESVSAAAGVAPIGWRTLVAPSVMEDELPVSVAVADRKNPGPVRFANDADLLLLLDGDDAWVFQRSQFTAEPVRSIYGYPMATVQTNGGLLLESGAGAVARRWWRVAIASEIAGTCDAIFGFMRQFLIEREQFGRPLGSFQALQHRILEAFVRIEGTKWSAREAAFLGAPAEQAATSAITAVETAKIVLNEAHQLAGAIGLTLEFDLHLWTLRLQSLRVEAGGVASHSAALADSRWRQQ